MGRGFAGTRKENLQIVSGRENASQYGRNADNLGSFCRNCSSMLYYRLRNAPAAHVQLGALLDDPGIRPQFQELPPGLQRAARPTSD